MTHRRRSSPWVSSLLTAGVAALIACGGASNGDLFGGAGAGGGDDDAGAPAQGDSAATGTPDASIPVPTADAAPPLPGADAAPSDSGAPFDASVPDTFVPPVDPGITCGAASCDPTRGVCCRFAQPTTSYACVPQGRCQAPGALAIACDDAADCASAGHPGQVCCATLDGQTGAASEVRCRTADNCVSRSQVVVCDPTVADACPAATPCQASKTSLPDYYLCLPPRP